MTVHSISRQRRKHNEELSHLGDLIRLRSLFERFGATADELALCDAEIARYRQTLAPAAA